MAKTATVFSRVEPSIKTQAEDILNKLGINMSTAIEIYLRQIVLQSKIPFEIKLNNDQVPISYENLSKEEFNNLMEKSIDEYKNGKCSELNEYKEEFFKKFKI